MLSELSVLQLIFIASVISAAYLVRGVAGFGSGLIAIPLLVISLPIVTVVPLVVILDYLASASQGLKNREQIRWQEIFPLLPFTMVGVMLALYLLKMLDAKLLMHSLGVFILIYALYNLFIKPPNRKHSRVWAIPAGTMGGLVGTLFGTGGPFYIMYLQLRSLEKSQFRATFAAIFLLDGTYRIGGYLVAGLVNINLLQLLAIMTPIMSVSIYLGGHIHTTVTQEAFKRGISLLLLGSGVVLLLK